MRVWDCVAVIVPLGLEVGVEVEDIVCVFVRDCVDVPESDVDASWLEDCVVVIVSDCVRDIVPERVGT